MFYCCYFSRFLLFSMFKKSCINSIWMYINSNDIVSKQLTIASNVSVTVVTLFLVTLVLDLFVLLFLCLMFVPYCYQLSGD